jgi:hypothetical protein
MLTAVTAAAASGHGGPAAANFQASPAQWLSHHMLQRQHKQACQANGHVKGHDYAALCMSRFILTSEFVLVAVCRHAPAPPPGSTMSCAQLQTYSTIVQLSDGT